MKLKEIWNRARVENNKDKEFKNNKRELKVLHEYCEELEKKLDKETMAKKVERLENEVNHNIHIKNELREDNKNLIKENKELKEEINKLKQELKDERNKK